MPQLAKRLQGLIDQIEQQGLSSINVPKEEALLALDLIQSGNTNTDEMIELQDKADGTI